MTFSARYSLFVFLPHCTFFDCSICSTLYLLVTRSPSAVHQPTRRTASPRPSWTKPFCRRGVMWQCVCANAWTAGIVSGQRARLAFLVQVALFLQWFEHKIICTISRSCRNISMQLLIVQEWFCAFWQQCRNGLRNLRIVPDWFSAQTKLNPVKNPGLPTFKATGLVDVVISTILFLTLIVL